MNQMYSRLWVITWVCFTRQEVYSKGLIRSGMKNVMIAHGEVYHELKKISPTSHIGLAKNVTIFDLLRRWNLIHWLTTLH